MNPRRPLVLALAAWTAIGIAAAWLPWAVVAWQVAGVLIAGVAAADWLALRRLPDPSLTRRMGRTLPLGVWSPVTLVVANPSAAHLKDRHPRPPSG